MIDSIEAKQLKNALIHFRDYISENYNSESLTAIKYMQIAEQFETYAEQATVSFEDTLKSFYQLIAESPAFEHPKNSKKCNARAILMIADFFKGENPKRKYLYNSKECPETFRSTLDTYRLLMTENLKSDGNIRTRIGRIKILFIYLDEHGCKSLKTFTGKILVDFIGSLNGKYCSQSKASILYTMRNFFSYETIAVQMSFDPMVYLDRIHSKKHERLASFYTADEVRKILNEVNRTTPWGKTIYLMMLLACIYGMRSSDIKQLKLSDIHWSERTIIITQFKTKQTVRFPLIDEITFALLDYIKNVRPATEFDQVFIRMRPPYVPYSMNDHFGDKLSVYFEKAGVSTNGKHHGLHSLRHSLATKLLEGNTPINEIAVILGHTSVSATKTYIWSDIEHLRAAALEVPSYD